MNDKECLFRNIKGKQGNCQNAGITLVALIITMLVLLILASVVVNLGLGENGLIGKSQNAVEKYKNAVDKEKYNLELAQQIVNNRGMVMVDKDEYDQLKLDVDNLKSALAVVNSGYQSGSGTVAITGANTSQTLKEFSNLDLGTYLISYTQYGTGEAQYSSAYIYLNDNLLAASVNGTGSGSGASPCQNATAIVNITNDSDKIKLKYSAKTKNSAVDRSYYWQLIRLGTE